MLESIFNEMNHLKKDININKKQIKLSNIIENQIEYILNLLNDEAKLYGVKEKKFSLRNVVAQQINKITELLNNVYRSNNFYGRLKIRYAYLNYLHQIANKNNDFYLNLKQVLLKHLAIIDDYDEREFLKNENIIRCSLKDLPSNELKSLGIPQKSDLPKFSIDKIRIMLSSGFVNAQNEMKKYVLGDSSKIPNDYIIIKGYEALYREF